MVTVRSRSDSRNSTTSVVTSPPSANITVASPTKTSFVAFAKSTASRSTSDTFGIEVRAADVEHLAFPAPQERAMKAQGEVLGIRSIKLPVALKGRARQYKLERAPTGLPRFC